MLKNKKGFTLIELLAVIVILAIILAIAIPGVTSIIKSAKRNAFISDGKMIVKAVENQRLQEQIDPDNTTTPVSFTSTSTSAITTELAKYGIATTNYEGIELIIPTDEDDPIYLGLKAKSDGEFGLLWGYSMDGEAFVATTSGGAQ